MKHLKLDYNILVFYDQQIYLAIYINNLLIFGSNNFCLTNIQDQFNAQFIITTLGKISHYISIEVDIEIEKKISLS